MKYAVIIFLFAVSALAEDFPGGNSTSEEEFKKGFGAESGMQDSDQKTVDADRLKIGGSLFAEYLVYTFENLSRKDYISTPATLEMYLDSQLKNDVRFFSRGRLIHDASVDETVPSPLTGLSQKQTTSSLDELKLSFHTQRKIFWTLGKQKIKWGASKFWNPTDFLNLQKRDFFKVDDQRAGISMIKAHVPLGSANFYLMGINDRANEISQTGTAARIEVPVSTAEISLTSYGRKGQPTKIGGDLSFALGDFDFYAEGAKSDSLNDQNISGGTTYQFKYSDEDVASLNLEGYWQENGVDNKSLYTAMVLSSRWIPFYVGKSYGLASLYLPKPGGFNDSDYSLYFIQNLSDQSFYYRCSWTYTGMSDLMWITALGNRGGDRGTEMKLFNQGFDASVQMKVVF